MIAVARTEPTLIGAVSRPCTILIGIVRNPTGARSRRERKMVMRSLRKSMKIRLSSMPSVPSTPSAPPSASTDDRQSRRTKLQVADDEALHSDRRHHARDP